MMSLGVVLKVERVPPFIVWGIVHRGSNTPSVFSTSFLPGLIGFSSDLWFFALLVGLTCPRDPILIAIFFGTLGGFRDLLPRRHG